MAIMMLAGMWGFDAVTERQTNVWYVEGSCQPRLSLPFVDTQAADVALLYFAIHPAWAFTYCRLPSAACSDAGALGTHFLWVRPRSYSSTMVMV